MKMHLCCSALNLTQEKTTRAEEEGALLEEQSRHYKDERDKALRQIEKLNANSQSVRHIPPTVFFSIDCFFRVVQGRLHGCSLIVDQTKLRSETLRVQIYRLPSRIVTLLPGRPRPRLRKSQVLIHAFSLFSQLLITITGGKGKKATKKPETGKARQKNQPLASDNKGKRKALTDGDGSEAVEDANDKKTTKPTKAKAKKSQTTAKESRPTGVENDNDDDTEDTAVPKKKRMRKLNVNIFGSSKADSLDWANQFNLVSSHIAARILSHDCVC